MIPISEIRAWNNVVSWISDEQVEQDLVICRSLVEINCREHFRRMSLSLRFNFKVIIQIDIKN